MDKKEEKKEKDQKEICVICQKETPYTKNTPVDLRRNYVEGVGQVCDSCAENLRKEGAVV